MNPALRSSMQSQNNQRPVCHEGSPSGPTVLLVDDDELQLKLSTALLNAAGFVVLATSSGVRAIDIAKHSPPDLVLSDVLMQELDGFELCRRLRTNPLLADVPVVLVSAQFRDAGDRKLAQAVGAMALIEKSPDFTNEISELQRSMTLAAPVLPKLEPCIELYSERLSHQLGRLLARCQDSEAKYHALLKNDGDESSQAVRQGQADADDDLEELLANISEIIWSASSAAAVDFIGGNVEKVFGMTKAEVLTHGVRYFYRTASEQDAEKIDLAFHRLWSSHEAFTLDVPLRGSHQQIVWIRTQAHAKIADDGSMRFFGTLSDVTAQKKLELQMQHSKSLEGVIRLTRGFAHDFNNILAAILANSQFLIEGLGSSDPLHEDATEIKHAAERAASITKNLIGYVKRQSLTSVFTEVQTVVQDVNSLLLNILGKEAIVSTQKNAEANVIRADAAQVEQVLVTLALSVFESSGGDGRLSMDLANVQLNKVVSNGVNTVFPGNYVRINLHNGAKSPSHLELSHEPVLTNSLDGQGAGVGFCRNIIAELGGYAGVCSAPGQPLAWEVLLPSIEPVEAMAGSGTADGTAHFGETILVVESDPQVRAAVSRILSREGYQVLLAQDFESALSAFKRHEGKVDLVLSDVVTPDGSGITVIE